MSDPTTRIDGHLLAMRRLFDAPPDEVFAAFTDPEQLDLWWGPDDYQTVTFGLDLRPGGIWHYALRTAGAPDIAVKSWYQEIVPPERLVYRDTFVDAAGEQLAGSPEILVTIVFRAVGERTDVTMTSDLSSPDVLLSMVSRGMVEGVTQSFVRLDAVLRSRRE